MELTPGHIPVKFSPREGSFFLPVGEEGSNYAARNGVEPRVVLVPPVGGLLVKGFYLDQRGRIRTRSVVSYGPGRIPDRGLAAQTHQSLANLVGSEASDLIPELFVMVDQLVHYDGSYRREEVEEASSVTSKGIIVPLRYWRRVPRGARVMMVITRADPMLVSQDTLIRPESHADERVWLR